MKTLRISFALVVAAFAASSLVQAEQSKPAGEAAACCKKAAEANKACPHGCCVTAAKETKNCEKCGGKNEAKTDKVS
jgi:hypothetical protein